jgi:tRNA threonylcarbamoyl adenosine modification protein YeaZ
MLVLALETTGELCSIAVSDGLSLKCMFLVRTYRDLLRRLPELTRSVLDFAHCSFSDISLIAVSIGPGSFTGTRIGIAYAKALAYSLRKPIIGIRTLECMAHMATVSEGQRVFVLYPSRPTRLMEAYFAMFAMHGGELTTLRSECVVDVGELAKEILNDDSPAVLCGAFSEAWHEVISQLSSAKRGLLNIVHVVPTACGVAQLAYRRWERSGRGDDIFQLKPLYVLPSQAEERFRIRVT